MSDAPRNPDRAPPLAHAALSPAQLAAVEAFRAARGTEIEGPWHPLLRSPELMSRVRGVGDYVRYRTSLSPRLSEFLILLTARQWTQQFEWNCHCPIALASGVDLATVSAIAEGRRPTPLAEDETVLYDFFTELTQNRRISDATYDAMVAAFKEQGVYDAVGIIGYYTLLAMTMNTAQTAFTPDPAAIPLRIMA
jgi:4-carboxymuconolactone decarboxylase